MDFDLALSGGEGPVVLREIKNVRQEYGAGPRRWFESDGLELVVWFSPGGAVEGFQLCYDFGQGEHALTWRAGSGFTHCEIDAGEATPFKNETPVLTPKGTAPWMELVRGFDRRSAALDADLRAFVREKLIAGITVTGEPAPASFS